MPKLLEEKEINLEFSDLANMRPKEKISDGKRSNGIHLSGIIKFVMVTCGLLTPDDDTVEIMPLRMAVGVAWEAFVVQLWPSLIWQPGEIKMDGIVGSPDGINTQLMPEAVVLEEIKCTWMSRMEPGVKPPVPRNILNMKRWMMQVAGYCHMASLTHCRLHVLWVNGDYRSSGPQYYTYLISFTEAELARMWNNMILPNVSGATPEVH